MQIPTVLVFLEDPEVRNTQDRRISQQVHLKRKEVHFEEMVAKIQGKQKFAERIEQDCEFVKCMQERK